MLYELKRLWGIRFRFQKRTSAAGSRITRQRLTARVELVPFPICKKYASFPHPARKTLLHHDAPGGVAPEDRGGEEEGVYAVEHSAVAGEEGAGIFYVGAALDQRFDQVSELGCDVQDKGQRDDEAAAPSQVFLGLTRGDMWWVPMDLPMK